MKRTMRAGGRSLALEWTRVGDRLKFRIDGGDEREASVVEAQPGSYSILVGGSSYDPLVSKASDGEYFIELRGRRFAIEVIDPRETAVGARAGQGEGRVSLKAPMPGKIVRVLARPGEEVRAGQGLVIIEAMKMQNELKSPKDGRVVSLETVDGQAVGAGEVLAVVE